MEVRNIKQPILEGLTGYFGLKSDSEEFNVDIFNIRSTPEGNVGTIEVDDGGLKFIQESVKFGDEITCDKGEIPFVVEDEKLDDNSRRNKIIVSSAIGGLLVGSALVGAKFYWERRKKT